MSFSIATIRSLSTWYWSRSPCSVPGGALRSSSSSSSRRPCAELSWLDISLRCSRMTLASCGVRGRVGPSCAKNDGCGVAGIGGTPGGGGGAGIGFCMPDELTVVVPGAHRLGRPCAAHRRHQVRLGQDPALVSLRLTNALDLEGDCVDRLFESFHAGILRRVLRRLRLAPPSAAGESRDHVEQKDRHHDRCGDRGATSGCFFRAPSIAELARPNERNPVVDGHPRPKHRAGRFHVLFDLDDSLIEDLDLGDQTRSGTRRCIFQLVRQLFAPFHGRRQLTRDVAPPTANGRDLTRREGPHWLLRKHLNLARRRGLDADLWNGRRLNGRGGGVLHAVSYVGWRLGVALG